MRNQRFSPLEVASELSISDLQRTARRQITALASHGADVRHWVQKLGDSQTNGGRANPS
jgi:hypothetical protein